MKIVYAAGDRRSSSEQLNRFLFNNAHRHTIKVAAFYKSSLSLDYVDWTLDSLYNPFTSKDGVLLKELFGHHGIPKGIGVDECQFLIEDIENFAPDLIISDGEQICAHVAKTLDIRLWYCSSLHLLDCIDWEAYDHKYNLQLERLRKVLSRLPKAERTFIYSPFYKVETCPSLLPGYEWVKPYYINAPNKTKDLNLAIIKNNKRFEIISKILQSTMLFECKVIGEDVDLENYKEYLSRADWVLSTGETSFISDALLNGAQSICVTPTLDDDEALLNSIMCRKTEVGFDLAQVEKMERFAVNDLDRFYRLRNSPKCLISIDYKTIGERIDELCT